MPVVHAVLVMGEDVDDAAFGDGAFGAFLDHAGDFALQRIEAADTAFDLGKMTLSDGVDLLAWTIGLVGQISSTSKPSSRAWRIKRSRRTASSPYRRRFDPVRDGFGSNPTVS
jgi:hypothetical protein